MSADHGGGTRRRRRSTPEPVPPADETRFLAIGEVAAPRGVRGELRVRILTDFPERFKRLHTAYVGEEHTPFEVERTRRFQDAVLVKLRGIDTPEAARALVKTLIYVPEAEAVPLQEDQYYWYQIIGLEVWTVEGRRLGEVTDILATGSNDVYIVRGEGGEVLVPAIEDVVTSIDLAARRIIVQPLEGML